MQKFVGKLKKSFRDKKGFTLIELIVVIAIIGILVLLAAPKFLGYTKDAKVATMQADAKVLSNASLMYNIDTETWPQAVTVDAGVDTILGNDDDVITVDPAVDITGKSLETALTDKYTTAPTVYALDEAAFDTYIKNLEGDFSDFVIVLDGDAAGEVFHIDGVEDGDGVTFYGTDKTINTPPVE